MDPITLIVTALAAGVSAGAIDSLKDDVRESVNAAYKRMHYLAKRCFRGNASAEIILFEHGSDPATYEAPLAKKLAEAGAMVVYLGGSRQGADGTCGPRGREVW